MTTSSSGRKSIVRRQELENFTGQGYDKGRSKVWQAAWFAVSNLVFVKWWVPEAFRVGLLRAFGADVGDDVKIKHNVTVHWPWKLSIGAHTWIGEGVHLLNLEDLTIGQRVCISQHAVICTGSHRSRDPHFEFDNAPIVIEDESWICLGATVLRGVTVGRGSVVGANSTVRRNVDAYSTVASGAMA